MGFSGSVTRLCSSGRLPQYIGLSLLGAVFPAASRMLRDPAAIIPNSLEAWKN